MPKRLILVRHAKSSWAHDLADHRRPLNARGLRSAPLIGDWLRKNGYVPDVLLCSSAERTKQTCDGLGFDDVARAEKDTLYLASAEKMRKVLSAADGPCVCLIGHNPGIADLAHRLVATPPAHDRFADYPTGATTVIDFDVEDWSEVTFGSGEVIGFTTPRDLE
ncbi:histidine phosphatase family protein [Cognatishimia sp. SS12]|uniref:SixA phosphatase family protein n=1 Tax=Cognatishimia sp. SS12 TaxID=2979465 RepID=UPI00232F0979|nr:histidine phosphatase family protein [Cognatishimia sp. SS12]MDC0738341.1 histidine phosphatase family protein [Cognatishimia sp. SS12]